MVAKAALQPKDMLTTMVYTMSSTVEGEGNPMPV